ncbi:uncharacterized protein LOC142894282 [Nelusetta ayraudi]|uniref:uncharacterized protein LOC142894282 n=1 Tax=Nelusetta ayraudi TaxID=303726 RepID=UPI003F703B87
MVAAVHKAGWRHQPCFAHTLNLIVKDSLKSVPEVVKLLEKCTAIVSFFHHSTQATEKLRATQQQLKVAEHKLFQGSSLATQLAQQCQRRFRGIETIYCLAASIFLDVRFKHLGFRDKGNVEVVKKHLVSELQEVYQTEHTAPSLAPSSTATVSSTSSPSISGPSATGPTESPAPYGSGASKAGIWTDFDTQVLSGQYHWSATSEVLIEVRRYSEEKVIPRDKVVLVWWRDHEQTFPVLSKLAVSYLGITATSVPSERVFSKAGEVLSKKRNRLKGKTVNMLLFLNKNL